MDSVFVERDCFVERKGLDIMHAEEIREDPYGWEEAGRLTYVGRANQEELGMYVEDRDARKRKWQSQEPTKRKLDDAMDDKEQRKIPPKKVFGKSFIFFPQ